jgi:hypothetical protein
LNFLHASGIAAPETERNEISFRAAMHLPHDRSDWLAPIPLTN